jgi:dienelactone hydrolase
VEAAKLPRAGNGRPAPRHTQQPATATKSGSRLPQSKALRAPIRILLSLYPPPSARVKTPPMRALLFSLLLLLPSFFFAQAPDRATLLKKMEQAMGPLPGPERKVPLDVKIVSEEKLDGFVRKKLTYAAEKDDRVPAWLLIPDGGGKHPAMLCLHQTIPIGKDEPAGLGVQESKRQALDLAKRGYVTLAPDYPSFGEYQYDFQKASADGRYQSGTMKAIWNNMRAVDLLQSLPEVDGERLGVIGHSLGGHNSMYTAAFDERLKVTVSSCGFTSFYKYMGGNLKGWTSDRYMPRIASVYDNDPKKMPFDFEDVVLAICPRAFFAMSPLRDHNFDVSGVDDVIAKVQPVYQALGVPERLKVVHPDAIHEWPAPERAAAYEFIDRQLKGGVSNQ